MGIEMVSVMLKAMGIDATQVMGQAQALGAAFERIATTQAAISAQLQTLQAGQDAISAAMGLYVAPPTEDMLALIDAESARFLEPVQP